MLRRAQAGPGLGARVGSRGHVSTEVNNIIHMKRNMKATNFSHLDLDMRYRTRFVHEPIHCFQKGRNIKNFRGLPFASKKKLLGLIDCMKYGKKFLNIQIAQILHLFNLVRLL